MISGGVLYLSKFMHIITRSRGTPPKINLKLTIPVELKRRYREDSKKIRTLFSTIYKLRI